MRGRKIAANGRSKGVDRHVRLHHWLLDCAAYRSLNPYAVAALIAFYKRFNGSNNGNISMGVRELAGLLSITPKTAVKTMRDLEDRGFIRPNQRGSFSWKVHVATTWVLTEFEFAGQVPAKDFMRWVPPPEIQNTVPHHTTDGTPSYYRGLEKQPQKPPDGTPSYHREGKKRRPTVPPRTTHIVYQEGADGVAKIEPEEIPPVAKNGADPPRVAKRKKARAPVDALAYMGMIGGLKDDPRLRGMDAQRFDPRYGSLIRKKGGLTFAVMGAKLQEAGYLVADGDEAPTEGQFIDFLRDALLKPSYSESDRARVQSRAEKKQAEREHKETMDRAAELDIPIKGRSYADIAHDVAKAWEMDGVIAAAAIASQHPVQGPTAPS